MASSAQARPFLGWSPGMMGIWVWNESYTVCPLKNGVRKLEER